jgi:predicted nucleic acid-binding protein
VRDRRLIGLVPDFVYLEVANSFLKYLRQGTMTGSEADAHLDLLLDAPLTRVRVPLLARQALALGLVPGLSAYDAAYLALALGNDAILVTADRRLAAEAEKSALLPDDGPPV